MNESPLYSLLFDKVLIRLDPEVAHHLTVHALRLAQAVPGGRALLRTVFRTPSPRRSERGPHRALGLDHPTPFGLGAGFDKDAEVALALLDLGFGHVEVGTITAEAQPGNPTPRSFRLPADRALVNRMGFNNHGARAAARRLARIRAGERGQRAVIGVNIGKTKSTPLAEAAEDYRTSAHLLAPYASYLAVNVSSPNTPGLRELQGIDQLRPILAAVVEEAEAVGRWSGREVPVLVKIAPDLHDADVRAVAHLATEVGLAGVIATNTTIDRPAALQTDRARIDEIGTGGLSGPVLGPRALEILGILRRELPTETTVISCGGVGDADDVRERLTAGADLVQGYTGMIYQGPGWPGRIARAL